MSTTHREKHRPGRTTQHRKLTAAAAMLAMPLSVCYAASAKAEPKLGVDVNLNYPHDRDDTDSGGGVGVRIGNEWDLLLLRLTPEASATYAGFRGPSDAAAYQLMGGARLGVGFIIEPSIYAHAGGGYLDWGNYDSGVGVAYDAGAALDLTVLPLIDLGLHAALAGISSPASDSPALNWTVLGAHFAIELN